ncbi:MAG TPA: M4 family metallopeptidase [Chitinophagaceae bacterium]|nr:M4 family metallopeptidase [Chitinophagaceae bacterium]
MKSFILFPRQLACCVVITSILLFHHQQSFAQLSERQQQMRNALAADPAVKEFNIDPVLKTPSFISFVEASPHSAGQARSAVQQYFLLDAGQGNELRLAARSQTKSGVAIERYQQYYNGIKMEHAAYAAITSAGKLRAINAESYELPKDFTVAPSIPEARAKELALGFVNARKYSWQALEEDISKAGNNTILRERLIALRDEYTPKGELVIAKDLYHTGQARLAWKFDIYATEPLSRNYIYIDAHTGAVNLVNPIIKHTDGGHKPATKNPAPVVNKQPVNTYPWFLYPFGINVAGTATTRYAGTRQIQTTLVTAPFNDPNNTAVPLSHSGVDPRTPVLPAQSVYILKDGTRGKGIETYDMNAVGGIPLSLPGLHAQSLAFTDIDNNWKDETLPGTNQDLIRGVPGNVATEGFNDDMAIDAHWGAEMVYDYWLMRHGRQSFDDRNSAIKSYVHYGPAYDNAFWNGSVMTYGDGSGAPLGFKPLTSLDVCGHEIGHGVCSFTSDLVYQGESGAMNEALSDIWAAAVERFVNTTVDPSLSFHYFQIGEQIDPAGVGIRRMDNPKAYSNPDTYGGQHWSNPNCTPTLANDQCGVHNNSGVLNKWFYLVVMGPGATTGSPSYTDDGLSDAVGVNPPRNYGALGPTGTGEFIGIGFDKAEAITYLMELTLTPNATFAQARTASINAARLLYGDCSQEEKTVTDAWYAINVGPSYAPCAAPPLIVSPVHTQVKETAPGGCDRYTEYNINVNLTSSPGTPVTVTFSVTGGTLQPQEYAQSATNVNYAAGETGLKNIKLRIYDDAMVEGNETIEINATSASPAYNNTFSITIADDDVDPVIGGTITLLNENFESTAEGSIPAGWSTVDKIIPSPVSWKVYSPPAVPLGLNWTTKRAIIEWSVNPGQATYDQITEAQTILRTPLINAAGLSNIRVQLSYNSGGEPCPPPITAACDYGQLKYSFDGTTFFPFTAEDTVMFLKPTDGTLDAILPASFNNKQFYLGLVWNNDANAGTSLSITIDNVVVTGQGKKVEGDASATVSEKVWVESGKPAYFYSTADGELMAKIINSSNDLGCATVSFFEAGNGSVPLGAGKRSKKVFSITPAQNGNSTYTLTLYYTTAELSTGFTVAPAALSLLKTNAASFAEINGSNSVIVTPVFEDHSADGYYAYTFTFSGFSLFALVDNAVALPVTLVHFTADKRGKISRLSWTTSNEVNTNRFIVERSVDGGRYNEIGSVAAAVNSSGNVDYVFSDLVPERGFNYYRLKIQNIDRSYNYSPVRVLGFDTKDAFVIFPNPARGTIIVSLGEFVNNVRINITDGKGQVVYRGTMRQSSAMQLDVGHLPAGMYYVELLSDRGKQVRKLIVNR